MICSPELDQLATALAAVQKEVPSIPKDETNPFFKSKYAGLPSVVETASPIITKHGLSVAQFPGTDEGGDTLTTWLLHSSGQFICDTMRLHLPKQDSQGQGSAMTYARRYAYMSALGLVADEDDDGNRATRTESGEPQATTHRAAPKPNTQPAGLISDAQLKLVAVLLNKLGIPDESKRTYVADLIGCEPKSSKELTSAEARKLIDALKAEEASL